MTSMENIQVTSMEKVQTSMDSRDETSMDSIQETSMEPQMVQNSLSSHFLPFPGQSLWPASATIQIQRAKPRSSQLKLPHHNGIDNITVKVDDGAEGNILPLNSFRAMFPHALDANSYPKPGFLRGSKMMLECYDDGKLVNHGSIKL